MVEEEGRSTQMKFRHGGGNREEGGGREEEAARRRQNEERAEEEGNSRRSKTGKSWRDAGEGHNMSR